MTSQPTPKRLSPLTPALFPKIEREFPAILAAGPCAETLRQDLFHLSAAYQPGDQLALWSRTRKYDWQQPSWHAGLLKNGMLYVWNGKEVLPSAKQAWRLTLDLPTGLHPADFPAISALLEALEAGSRYEDNVQAPSHFGFLKEPRPWPRVRLSESLRQNRSSLALGGFISALSAFTATAILSGTPDGAVPVEVWGFLGMSVLMLSLLTFWTWQTARSLDQARDGLLSGRPDPAFISELLEEARDEYLDLLRERHRPPANLWEHEATRNLDGQVLPSAAEVQAQTLNEMLRTLDTLIPDDPAEAAALQQHRQELEAALQRRQSPQRPDLQATLAYQQSYLRSIEPPQPH